MKLRALWSKDFSILTIGSFISTLGNVASYFTLGVLILRASNNVIYSVYLSLGTIISFFAPIIFGSWIDKVSKKKMIVLLDSLSATIFLILSLVIGRIQTDYVYLILFAVLINFVNTVYRVTYSSYFPNVTNKDFLNKGLAVNAMLFPIANSLVLPFASIFIKREWFFAIFLFNAITFIITAIFESMITNPGLSDGRNILPYFKRLIMGFNYVLKDIKIKNFIVFIFLFSITVNGIEALLLPFFINSSVFKLNDYSTISSLSTIGAMFMAIYLYSFTFKRINIKKLIRGLYYLYAVLYIFFFNIDSLIVITLIRVVCEMTYSLIGNIKETSVQLYVVNEYRGRFNAIILSTMSLGCLIGQLSAGMLSEWINISFAATFLCAIGIISCILFLGNKSHLMKIYDLYTVNRN